ncbi:MAG TPA: hypothetical protein PKE29_11470 [Phycisphaerales bacterium]|nr:hypothetical protein [Phycisphaerales bacterium]
MHALRKWRVIVGFWGVQALFVVGFGPIWVMQADTVAGPEHPLGVWHGDRIANLLKDPEYWGTLLLVIGGLMLLQTVLVWPVRKPRARSGRGWPLRLSIGAAALVGTMLAAAIFLGLATITQFNRDLDPGWDASVTRWMFYAWCALSYVCGAALMFGFCSRALRRGERHESVLARLAAMLFTGTLVEAVAILPIDVMFRRKEDCYCFAGTFWAFTLLLGAGLVVIGPAVLLPMLMRRRKRWYASHCDCCGYDMTGLIESGRAFDRCPECGAGWRYEPSARAEAEDGPSSARAEGS